MLPFEMDRDVTRHLVSMYAESVRHYFWSDVDCNDCEVESASQDDENMPDFMKAKEAGIKIGFFGDIYDGAQCE